MLAQLRAAGCCAVYDRRRFPDDEAVAAMREMHHTEMVRPRVYDDNLLRITATGRPPRCGWRARSTDSNRPQVRRLLETTLDYALRSHSAPTEITLDLSSLRFIDVAGAVEPRARGRGVPRARHRLVLTGARPGCMRVLDRCGAPFAAQLEVGPGSRRTPGGVTG